MADKDKETKAAESTAEDTKIEDPFDEIIQSSFPALGMEVPRVHAIYKFLAYEPHTPGIPVVAMDPEGRRKVLAVRASNLAGKVTSDRKAILGDYIKLSRLNSIFLAAFSKVFKHCPFQDVVDGKSFVEELVYEFGDPEKLLSWSGRVETKSWNRTKAVLGRHAWKEYKITLANDGFLFLEPRLLNLEPLAETYDHHAKYQTRTKWYLIDREDMGDQLPAIMDFARQFFPSAEFEILTFLTSDAQALDIEFYHVSTGVVLTVQFEIGFPERQIDPSWFVSRKSKVLK